MIITHLSTDNTLTMKPTIYIGLGGTGIKAVSHTKKMYEDMYGVGNIPPHIAFLVLDYYSEYTSPHLATSIEDDAVPLKYNGSSREHYERLSRNGAYKWMFPSNTCYIANNINECAYQVRTNGRFYTELMRATIEQALQARWQQVTNFIYGVAPANVDVHIVTSLCGGTGAGSFINIAELVQRNFGNRANIIGHGVMHGIFRAMDPIGNKVGRVSENAYSAIMDLDYLMSASMDNPITFEINGATRTFTRPIFNEFFAIDNRTPNGFIVNNTNTLCKNIAVYLFADNLNSQNTGLGAEWFDGRYNILNKIGWVQSFGACQVVYKGEELADLYAKRYAVKLIEKMCNKKENEAPLEWVTATGLREDGEYTQLTESIFSTNELGNIGRTNVLLIDSTDITLHRISCYLNELYKFSTNKTIALLEEKKNLFDSKIEELLHEGEIVEAKVFVERHRSNFNFYIQNQNYYIDKLKEYIRDWGVCLDGAWGKYKNARNGPLFLLRKKKCQELLDNVDDIAYDILKAKYDLKRREAAVEIYNSLIEQADCKLREIEGCIHTLENLRNEYTMAANECMLAPYNVYEYDLSTKERVEMHVDDNDVDLQAFCTKFYKPILEMDIEHELKPAIYDFAKSRPQAIEYRKKHLVDVINNMSDEDFKLLKDKILRFSSPLLQINNRGQKNNFEMTPSEIMNHTYTFYYHEGDNNRLINSFQGNIMADFVQHKFGLLHQKMFVTKKGTAIIPYCIDSLDEITQDAYEREVRNSSSGQTFNPHFDKTLFEEMRKKNFRLKPEDTDSPEDIPNA